MEPTTIYGYRCVGVRPGGNLGRGGWARAGLEMLPPTHTSLILGPPIFVLVAGPVSRYEFTPPIKAPSGTKKRHSSVETSPTSSSSRPQRAQRDHLMKSYRAWSTLQALLRALSGSSRMFWHDTLTSLDPHLDESDREPSRRDSTAAAPQSTPQHHLVSPCGRRLTGRRCRALARCPLPGAIGPHRPAGWCRRGRAAPCPRPSVRKSRRVSRLCACSRCRGASCAWHTR